MNIVAIAYKHTRARQHTHWLYCIHPRYVHMMTIDIVRERKESFRTYTILLYSRWPPLFHNMVIILYYVCTFFIQTFDPFLYIAIGFSSMLHIHTHKYEKTYLHNFVSLSSFFFFSYIWLPTWYTQHSLTYTYI